MMEESFPIPIPTPISIPTSFGDIHRDEGQGENGGDIGATNEGGHITDCS